MPTAPAARAAEAHKNHRVTPYPDQLVFAEEFAEIIGRSPSAVRYMIHKGTAPRSALIGGRRMFKLSEIHAWIDAQFDAEDGAK